MNDGNDTPANERTENNDGAGQDAAGDTERYSRPAQPAAPGEYSRPGGSTGPDGGAQPYRGAQPYQRPEAMSQPADRSQQPDGPQWRGQAGQGEDRPPVGQHPAPGPYPQGERHPQGGTYSQDRYGQGAQYSSGGPSHPGQNGPGQYTANPWPDQRQWNAPQRPESSPWPQGSGGYYGGAPNPGSQGGFDQPPGDQLQSTQLQSTQPRRTGRGKLVAGALALALVAGGIGGGVVAAVGGSDGPGSGLSQTASGQPVANAPDGTVQAVAEAVLPSVVQIQVEVDGSGGEGSGVVLSDDGFVLTNNHVVAAAADAAPGAIVVAFNDGSTAQGEIVGRDPSSDIAVIKVDKGDLTPIKIGSSSSLTVGQNVVAVGSPLGLAGTVTTGIVSAMDRPVSATGEGTQDQSSVLDAIQTDAAINPGNSGGALVNLNGELIGINSAIASLGAQQGEQSGSIGLGFAIPVDQANRIAQELIQNGVATQAVLGVQVGGDPSVRGATVGDVERGGAAAEAGIEKGSVITKIDDRPIPDSESLVAAVRSYAPGSAVTMEVQAADGSTSTKDVTLGSQEVGSR